MPRKTISVEELDQFELDENGRIYWEGERVLTEVRLSVPTLVNIAVIVAAIGTFGTFLLTLLQLAGFLPV